MIVVCKTFFLSILGLKTNTLVTSAMKDKSNLTCSSDKRGKHEHHHYKLSQQTVEPIKRHIEFFNLAISHYRREHAPHRRYLPPKLSVTKMYDKFKSQNESVSIFYESYRRIIKELNIRFAKLGEEECKVCMYSDQHICDEKCKEQENTSEDQLQTSITPSNNSFCQILDHWEQHKERAKTEREKCKQDCETTLTADEIVVSADMQKILLLPRIPGIKSCIFIRRLVLFHETFAPIKKAKIKTQNQ